MKFEEIIPALKEGKKIKRKGWEKEEYIRKHNFFVMGQIVDEDNTIYALTINDLCANDWKICKEKNKVKLKDLTPEQFEKWRSENCKKYDCATDCPFRSIDCNETFWMSCKNMYSNKFLNQEVEVEE